MIITWNRFIKNNVPDLNTRKNFDVSYEPQGMISGLPIIWKKASGHSVWDISGNKFIDFTSTIFVTNAGHGATAGAIKKQADQLIHSYNYQNLPRTELVNSLRHMLPDFGQEPKIYFASAGSEVTDWAIKLMKNYNKRRKIIVSFEGSFHGKVGAAGKLEGEELRLSHPTKEEDWIEHKKILDENKNRCCGIMIESYQGWNAEFMPKQYVINLVEYCKKNGILVCFDEIQGGFWRTGMLFAYQWYLDDTEIAPDLICLGKALGNGVPISALVGRGDLFNVEGISSTHSANPLCCASAVEALKILRTLAWSDRLLNVTRILRNTLMDIAKTESIIVNGNGALWGLVFKNKEIADNVCWECMKNGLLVVRTGRESVKIGPPLSISESALKEGLSVLRMAITKSLRQGK